MRSFEPMQKVETPDGDGKVVRIMETGALVVKIGERESVYDPQECFSTESYRYGAILDDVGTCGCCKKARDLADYMEGYGEVCDDCKRLLSGTVSGVDPCLYYEGLTTHRRHM